MPNKYKNNDVIDDDVTDDDVTEDDNVEDEDMDQEEEEEEEETYIESLLSDIMVENREDVQSYTVKPSNTEEVTQNESVKKLIKIKLLDKILKSFKCMIEWEEDEELQKLFKACKRVMNKDPELEALDAMRHVIRKNNNIEDMIEHMLDEGITEDGDEEVEEEEEE
jgi:Tfp pilus assembly major pilin PilA